MRKLIFSSSLFLLLIPFLSAQAEESIGSVTKMRGTVTLISGTITTPLKVDAKIKEGDTIQTGTKSFAKVVMRDETVVAVGPSSEFQFIENKLIDGKRKNVYSLLEGTMRTIVKKKAEEGESIEYKSMGVAMGVRGTEFLSNAYMVKSVPTSDVMLLEGKIAGDASAVGGKAGKFGLEAGQAVNSGKMAAEGAGAIQKMSPEVLTNLKAKSLSFLPKMQAVDGSFVDLENKLRKMFKMPAVQATGAGAAAAGLLGGMAKKAGPDQLIGDLKLKKRNENSKIEGLIDYKYNLKNEPYDVRDAVMRRDELRRENTCFYFFHKRIPGSGERELFRRTRDCDEFENDLD